MSDFQHSDFEDQEGARQRRGTDPVIEVMAHNIKRMREDMGELRAVVSKLTDAVTKLAVVEERQVADRAALERAFTAIQKSDERCTAMFEKCSNKMERIESRVDVLEQAAPMQAQTSQWIINAVWACVAVVAMFAATKLGLMR